LLLSAVAPLSISAKQRREYRDTSAALPCSASSIVQTEWWRMVRLLSLLAVGPSLIALALATAPTIDPVVPAVATLSAGGQAWRVVPPSQAAAVNALSRWELPLHDRLRTAPMLVMTILGFGALIIAAGLALGTLIPRRNWAVAVSVGLSLLFAFVCPSLGMVQLFTQLVTREPQLGALGGWGALMISLVANILLVIVILWLTIRTIDRRSRTEHQIRVVAKPVPSI
jgi:hypothetical protein